MFKSTEEKPASWRRFVVASGITGVAILVVAYFALGKSVLEKLLTDLVMPMGLLWLTLTVLVVVLVMKRLYVPLAIAVIAWCVCFFGGNSYVANRMISSLENSYNKSDPFTVTPLDAVVLLGGSTSEAPNGQIQINENGDRIVLAARMFHRDLTKRIICTGAKIEGLSTLKRDEAEAGRLLLIDLGVPDAAIERFGGRNTYEEMQQIAKSVGSDTEVGVITSAWHLPRAMRLAKRAGINAVPLPADFTGESDEPKAAPPLGRILRRSIPNLSALGTNTRVLKEYLASLVGR